MVNIDKHIAHWRNGSDEDWLVAQVLLEKNQIRHALFFGHLALEKILKAHVCRMTRELAPPIHNLVRLAEKAGLELSLDQRDLLADVNEFNIECRYPELLIPQPGRKNAEEYLRRMDEIRKCWNSLL